MEHVSCISLVLYHQDKTTMSTTATASKNAFSQHIDLSFKDNSWDINKMHTTFDLLVSTLTAAEETPTTGTQLLYLMKAYRTNSENEDWMAHVRNMDSMINSNTIRDVQALQLSIHCRGASFFGGGMGEFLLTSHDKIKSNLMARWLPST